MSLVLDVLIISVLLYLVCGLLMALYHAYLMLNSKMEGLDLPGSAGYVLYFVAVVYLWPFFIVASRND